MCGEMIKKSDGDYLWSFRFNLIFQLCFYTCSGDLRAIYPVVVCLLARNFTKNSVGI